MKRNRYGKGLNREVVDAVKRGVITEPFSVSDVRNLAKQKGWDVPETYLRVCLANGTSETHSHTYGKYFVSLGDGKYKLAKKQ